MHFVSLQPDTSRTGVDKSKRASVVANWHGRERHLDRLADNTTFDA